MGEVLDDREALQASVVSDYVDLLNAGTRHDAVAFVERAGRADDDVRRLLTIARLLSVRPDPVRVERISARLPPWREGVAHADAAAREPDATRGLLEVTGLDHVALPVSDLDRAVAFYNGVLGLRIAGESRTPLPPTTPHVDFAAGQARLSVYLALPVGESSPHKSLAGVVQFPYVALRVPEHGSVLRRLRASGHPFDGPVPSGAGRADVHVWDPDGNQIDLVLSWPQAATP